MQLTEKCCVWWEFRRDSTGWGTKMVKVAPTIIFWLALTKGAMVVMILRQGGMSLWHKVQLLVCNMLWVNGILGWVTQGHSLLFHIQKWKKKKSLIIGRPKADEFIKLCFKPLKAVLCLSSHTIRSELLLLNKTYRDVAIREKFEIQFSAITN